MTAQDTVVWTVSRSHKPPFAGQFFVGDVFQRGLAFEDVRENITLPKAMAAHIEAHGVEHQVEESGESITHKFLYRNPRPPVAEPAALSENRLPQRSSGTSAGPAKAVSSSTRRAIG